MTKEEIRAKVVDVVNQVQEMSGRPSKELDDCDKPVGELEGFDSLNGFECTAMILGEIDVKIPGCGNAFLTSKADKALTLGEVVDRLYDLSHSMEPCNA